MALIQEKYVSQSLTSLMDHASVKGISVKSVTTKKRCAQQENQADRGVDTSLHMHRNPCERVPKLMSRLAGNVWPTHWENEGGYLVLHY